MSQLPELTPEQLKQDLKILYASWDTELMIVRRADQFQAMVVASGAASCAVYKSHVQQCIEEMADYWRRQLGGLCSTKEQAVTVAVGRIYNMAETIRART